MLKHPYSILTMIAVVITINCLDVDWLTHTLTSKNVTFCQVEIHPSGRVLLNSTSGELTSSIFDVSLDLFGTYDITRGNIYAGSLGEAPAQFLLCREWQGQSAEMVLKKGCKNGMIHRFSGCHKSWLTHVDPFHGEGLHCMLIWNRMEDCFDFRSLKTWRAFFGSVVALDPQLW